MVFQKRMLLNSFKKFSHFNFPLLPWVHRRGWRSTLVFSYSSALIGLSGAYWAGFDICAEWMLGSHCAVERTQFIKTSLRVSSPPLRRVVYFIKISRSYRTASANPLWYFIVSIVWQKGSGDAAEKKDWHGERGMTFGIGNRPRLRSLGMFKLTTVLIKGLWVDREMPPSVKNRFAACLRTLLPLTGSSIDDGGIQRVGPLCVK